MAKAHAKNGGFDMICSLRVSSWQAGTSMGNPLDQWCFDRWEPHRTKARCVDFPVLFLFGRWIFLVSQVLGNNTVTTVGWLARISMVQESWVSTWGDAFFCPVGLLYNGFRHRPIPWELIIAIEHGP